MDTQTMFRVKEQGKDTKESFDNRKWGTFCMERNWYAISKTLIVIKAKENTVQ